jgi:hypothetical protein
MFNLSWKTDVRLPEVQSTNKKELLEKTSKMIKDEKIFNSKKKCKKIEIQKTTKFIQCYILKDENDSS